MAALCAKINAAALCSRASQLRGGIPCTVDVSGQRLSSAMGGQNCHADIVFDDGVTWIARFRREGVSSPPKAIGDYDLRSEAATILFLQSQTRVPVPQVFGWAAATDPDNDVGVGYILMEKLVGKPVHWPQLSASEKEKVMQQLADVYLEIERHPFDRDPTKFGGIAFPPMFVEGRPLGPFSSSAEAARAIVKSYTDKVWNGEIGVNNVEDILLAHRFRFDLIDDVWPENGQQPGGETFYLRHTDDKGDHILVDELFNIVGIIDWEWAQTTSKEDAFCSPCMLWPVGLFYDGSNELSEEEVRFAEMFRERGRDDLADYVVRGRKVQRFFFGLGPLMDDQSVLKGLLTGVRQAFGFGDDENWEKWRAKALGK
ncbi:hypothetical protein N0V88_003720 [Collariella sp. IMI 366227]|nr:hypothetical protein N0V88_003720 [Collariella sp. IMI 366227]